MSNEPTPKEMTTAFIATISAAAEKYASDTKGPYSSVSVQAAFVEGAIAGITLAKAFTEALMTVLSHHCANCDKDVVLDSHGRCSLCQSDSVSAIRSK